MWQVVDRTLRYYISSELTTRGYILATGFENVLVDKGYLGNNTDPSKSRLFQYHKQHIEKQIQTGYTLVVMVYLRSLASTGGAIGFDLEYSRLGQFIQAYNIPMLMIVSVANYDQMWTLLGKLIQPVVVYYIHGNIGTIAERNTEVQAASDNGAKAVTVEKFFPPLPPIQKPVFDRDAYLASKTHFNIFADEPIQPGNLVVPGDKTFKINRNMYNLILAGGIKYDWERTHPKQLGDDDSNAYVFGPLFELNEYKKVAEITHYVEQSGLIDNDLAKVFKDLHYVEDPIDDIWEYDNPEYRKVIRQYYPQVIWTGEILEGNPGEVRVFAHYTSTSGISEGEIDGLIIDTGYFFVEENEELAGQFESLNVT